MDSLFHAVNIGGALIDGNLFLAPLAGYSDAAFRSLCADYGSCLSYSEMLSAEGFIRNNSKTALLLERGEGERFFGVQIFSGSPYSAAKAAKTICALLPRPTLIDLNCGCPVPKVVKTGAGSALLRSARLVYDMIKAMKDASDLPVTVKIRSGWDASSINYRETADAACQAGAALVCLHARTRSQLYTGQADWRHIADLKKNCPVPVFGSGDIFTAQDAAAMLTQTGCDGVMFARGAIGNPFIFRETRELLETGGVSPHSAEERIALGMRHLRLSIRVKGEPLACREMRKHFTAYTKGLPGSARFRAAIVRASTEDDYTRITEEYLTAPQIFPSPQRLHESK
ncbi:MAG: tRNA dihydrouridine synthase DusB [Spirochaetales bacterium]|jgi:nifR3 family TIM-barrel protein|nr:tRNA dihydrouridine synthase DusB [Spirochaetales bacterium]